MYPQRLPGAPRVSTQMLRQVAAHQVVAEESHGDRQESPNLKEGQDNRGDRASESRTHQARGKSTYGGTKDQGTQTKSVQGQDPDGQSTIDSKPSQWPRPPNDLDPNATPESARETHAQPQSQPRDIQEKQELVGDRTAEGPRTTLRREHEPQVDKEITMCQTGFAMCQAGDTICQTGFTMCPTGYFTRQTGYTMCQTGYTICQTCYTM